MGVFDVVATSAVRRAVLLELHDRPRQRRELLDDVDASKSAVYDALNELRDRDLLREGRRRRWETTGLGDLVADHVARRERASDVLAAHAEYWRTYDPSVLPEPFRASVGALAGCERLQAPEAEPFRTVTQVAEVIERADRLGLVAPMYHDRYAEAVECAAVDADARLLLDGTVFHEVSERESADWDDDNPRVRVADAAFVLVVTDDAVVLALPDEDGSFDLDCKLKATSDRALDWGRRLFEYAWREGTPLEAVDERATH